MLEVRDLGLGVREIRPRRFADERGFFSEVWNAETWREAGLELQFVQDNHSLSRARGVLRGLHFQSPPFAQEKLVRVTRGSVFDVAVDIRSGSPTFGQWVSVVLSAEAWNQVLVPAGFAHGFLTLEPDTEVQYKVTAPYSAAHDRAIRWNDPAIGIEWPLEEAELTLSAKDQAAPLLAQADTGF
ncbi:dTDP-4-dehydrorhamnose 3,5-epimerase [Sphingomonas arenae]|uniref:dTDP-4-dehydrorhamnose 3,5-epimerase n=1 Tax=Sphingomonas arenae TaxID=2812555 RepID=UPI0030133A95